MTLTKTFVADAFLAAARDAGLKKVMVCVGQLHFDAFLVTLSLPNPLAYGSDDELLVASAPYEFDDARHVQELAAAQATQLARALPTIH